MSRSSVLTHFAYCVSSMSDPTGIISTKLDNLELLFGEASLPVRITSLSSYTYVIVLVINSVYFL